MAALAIMTPEMLPQGLNPAVAAAGRKPAIPVLAVPANALFGFSRRLQCAE
jgi:hypothetical protein